MLKKHKTGGSLSQLGWVRVRDKTREKKGEEFTEQVVPPRF